MRLFLKTMVVIALLFLPSDRDVYAQSKKK